LWQARERLGQFIGADPRRLIFTANVTAAVNTVAASLRLPRPGEILLTDHEYGAMHWCWERAAQRQGLTLRTFALPVETESAADIVAAFRAAINDQTRLLFFSHALSPTGLVLPAREICAEARRRGVITVIDGAHAPGMVPLDLHGLGCDFYGANGHKWLLAPTGAGFLYLGAGNEDRLQPLQVSWGWHADRPQPDERDDWGTTPRLRRFEFEGTRDPCPWLAVPAAIAFQEEIGWGRIRARNAELSARVRKGIGEILNPATPVNPELHGFMTAFHLPATVEAMHLRRQLWDQYRIEVPVVERPNGLLLRVSTHFYNSEGEIDLLASAMARLLGT
jgi:isopenicillin-N epimerase